VRTPGAEQIRAAASGRAAVQVVERIVITQATQGVARTPMHRGGIDVLRKLSQQLERGLVCDGDLPGVPGALDETPATF
jgi:hypothetical protein